MVHFLWFPCLDSLIIIKRWRKLGIFLLFVIVYQELSISSVNSFYSQCLKLFCDHGCESWPSFLPILIHPRSLNNSGKFPNEMSLQKNYTLFWDINNHKRAEYLLISFIALWLWENQDRRIMAGKSYLKNLRLHIAVKSTVITYSSQDLSQTVSSKSIISDSGKGFPFSEGFLSSAFFRALLIYKLNKIIA